MALISANTTVILPKFIVSDLKAKPIIARSKCLPVSAISVSSSSSLATAAPSQNEQIADSLCGWGAFAKRVSGEWNGFGADFTAEGNPVELPESVVPEDFREWEVQVYDWQTQCPTLASESTVPLLFYKLIKLFPTVGCEADAAVPYIIDKRIAGGTENNALALGYHPSGRYIGVWPVNGFEGKMMLELEHCIVNPKNWEERVRVVQVVSFGEGMMSLEKISVFSEEWYGPFNDGEMLGGCSLKETGVAMTSTVEISEVLGPWKGSESFAVARFESDDKKMEIAEEFRLLDDKSN
ncbi:hypothetical protein HPP92_012269 [Vanilla planifolia]|uniref:Uncharacterized protein n=1 Tax=Vanilla planifolia TaxID=51239 RepID=A0A835UYW2_VANPL|nr:hypothetical protein HPP92_012269 [Vanilla planifolia]